MLPLEVRLQGIAGNDSDVTAHQPGLPRTFAKRLPAYAWGRVTQR